MNSTADPRRFPGARPLRPRHSWRPWRPLILALGLIIGLLGKWVAPGNRDSIPLWLTVICGIGGMFIGSYENMRRISMRIREAALELGVKRIIFGECGHAWRVAYSFLNTLAGPFDFLDPKYPVPQHILEFTYNEIQKGTLKFDKSQNDHMVVTFHDSCNVARASRMGPNPGGQFEIPRAVIKAVCNHFVDMDPDTIHEKTFCCGGGGGLLTDDLMELRVKGAVPRVTALKQVIKDHGVTHMAAICAICKSQFTKVLPYYGLEMGQIVSLHQLVSNAIVLSGAQETRDEDDD